MSKKKPRWSPEYRAWRRAVLARDGHRCTECGAGDELEVHHKLPWKEYRHLRFSVPNGQTLCKRCHAGTHRETLLDEKAASGSRLWVWSWRAAMWIDRETGERMDDYYERTNDPAITRWLNST